MVPIGTELIRCEIVYPPPKLERIEYIQPLYDYLHRELLKRRFLMMDKTPIQVLKEEDRRAQTKSYLWVVRTGDDKLNPIILYNYTPTRAGENAKQFLKGIEPGFYLMADAYQGYNKVNETKRCCCFTHIHFQSILVMLFISIYVKHFI